MHEVQRLSGKPSADEITNEVVRLHRMYLGKGPTKAKTYIEKDAVFCVLQEGATSLEQTLAASGRGGLANEARLGILRRAGEEVLGAKLSKLCARHVDAVVCGHCPDTEVTTVCFLLGDPL